MVLDIEDEFLLHALEYDIANNEHDQPDTKADEILHEGRGLAIEDDVSEVIDELIHGIELHDGLKCRVQPAHRLEDGGGISPCRDDYSPNMDHVTEKHRQSGQDKAEPQREHKEQRHQNR